MYFKFRTSQELREEIHAGALDIPWTWKRKEVVWKIKLPSQGIWTSNVQRCFSIGSWNPEEEQQQGEHIHFSADASNTEFSYRIIHSANQLSIHGAVAGWCEDVGMKSDEKPPKTVRVIGAMSKRGQNMTSNDGSPTAKARPNNLVMHSPCSEEISSRSLGSLVNPGNDDERKGVGQAPGNWMLGDSTLEVGYSQVSRQEKVHQATRKMGAQTKSDENTSSTRKLAASSPEFRTMEYRSSTEIERPNRRSQDLFRASALLVCWGIVAHGGGKPKTSVPYLHFV